MHPSCLGKPPGLAAGFTLIEVMIATLVFSVGMMAVITMEFSAISAYMEARDLTGATQVGDRIVAHMEAEAMNWSQVELRAAANNAEDGAGVNISLRPLYDAGNSPFGGGGAGATLIEQVIASDWQWQTVTPVPIDERLVPGGNTVKYCVYARGGQSNQITLSAETGSVTAGAGVATTTADREITTLVQTQIAVVYPGDGTGFRKGIANRCDAPLPGCTALPTLMLQPEGVRRMAVGDAALPPLDLCGWRAIYMGTVVRR